MKRPSWDETGLALAAVWALRGTCVRRQVGCQLLDAQGIPIGSGYNGPGPGQQHCIEKPCPGALAPSGTALEACEAIHAEQNALISCPDISRIATIYVTHSPCVHCVKMLLRTPASRIVFLERYAHDEPAEKLWTARFLFNMHPAAEYRTWVHWQGPSR